MAEEANKVNFIGNDLFVACNLLSQHCCEVPGEKKKVVIFSIKTQSMISSRKKKERKKKNN